MAECRWQDTSYFMSYWYLNPIDSGLHVSSERDPILTSAQLGHHAIWCQGMGEPSVHPNGSKMFLTEMERTMRLVGTAGGQLDYPDEEHMHANDTDQPRCKFAEHIFQHSSSRRIYPKPFPSSSSSSRIWSKMKRKKQRSNSGSSTTLSMSG